MNRTGYLWGACSLAAVLWGGAAPAIHAQVILSDTFESGAVGVDITGGVWGRTGFAGATPKYANEGNPFHTGAQYADFNNPTTGGDDAIMMTTAAGDPLGIAPQLINQVTTFSFNFFEPTTPAAAGVGTSVGYAVTNDLNAAGRAWRALIRAGNLSPDGVAPEGAAVMFPLETVNTVWMVANDTAADVSYLGRTVVSKRTDVWLAADGGAPMFAFSLARQNPTANLAGVGFRSFSTDVGRLFIDDVLVAPGATLDRSAIGFKPGDVNGDGNVDADDFAVIRDHFQKAVTMRTEGDLTGDGVVNFRDYRQWRSYASAEALEAAAGWGVPEPGAAALAWCAAVGVVGRIRRRRGR